MSYLLFKFQLYDITSRICDQLFGDSKPSREAITLLDREIEAEQQKWNDKYLLDGGPNLLQYHNQAHWNILHGCAHQLFLLLHRPFCSQVVSKSDFPAESRARCYTSAKALLNLHKLFCEHPQFTQYRRYNRGIGNLHALHGGVVLAALLLDEPNQPGFHQDRTAFDELVLRIENDSIYSSISAKSLPLLRYLQ
jgi:hypothetical protein